MFAHLSPNFEKLLRFGFTQNGTQYFYATKILDEQFEMRITLFSSNGAVQTEVIDLATEEPYTLHLVEGAGGAFVGAVRSEYERVLCEIERECFDKDVFKSDYAHKIIEYVRKKYGNEPEYLWAKFPENAVWRRKDNKKWYGAILTTDGEKFGREGKIEIIDLRFQTETLEKLVDDKKYFLGWHMNKKHWVTLCLDGSVPLEEIFALIDNSYALAKKA